MPGHKITYQYQKASQDALHARQEAYDRFTGVVFKHLANHLLALITGGVGVSWNNYQCKKEIYDSQQQSEVEKDGSIYTFHDYGNDPTNTPVNNIPQSPQEQTQNTENFPSHITPKSETPDPNKSIEPLREPSLKHELLQVGSLALGICAIAVLSAPIFNAVHKMGESWVDGEDIFTAGQLSFGELMGGYYDIIYSGYCMISWALNNSKWALYRCTQQKYCYDSERLSSEDYLGYHFKLNFPQETDRNDSLDVFKEIIGNCSEETSNHES